MLFKESDQSKRQGISESIVSEKIKYKFWRISFYGNEYIMYGGYKQNVGHFYQKTTQRNSLKFETGFNLQQDLLILRIKNHIFLTKPHN